MSRIDTVVDEGRFRAVAGAGLDGVTGTFGTTDSGGIGDLLPVVVNSAGELRAADVDDCDGVIWVPEGRRERFRVTDAERNAVIGGKTYTVFERAIIADMEMGSDPLVAGDRIYSAAGGAISTDPAGVYMGVAITNPITGGVKFVLRVTTASSAPS